MMNKAFYELDALRHTVEFHPTCRVESSVVSSMWQKPCRVQLDLSIYLKLLRKTTDSVEYFSFG